MVTCEICGESFLVITNTHLRRHGWTVEDYKKEFSEEIYSDEHWETKRKYHPDRMGLIEAGAGKVPDSVLAKRVGISRELASRLRRDLKIPAFIGIILTQEGRPCRSIYEAKLDAWLHWTGQEHKHEVRVPGLPYIADFKVGKTYMEVVGMIGFRDYQEKVRLKHRTYDSHNIPCQWFEPGSIDYLYSKCPIPLSFREDRACSKCGRTCRHLDNLMCPDCNHHEWYVRSCVDAICQQCKQTYKKYPKARTKFCSRRCYWDSMKSCVSVEQIMEIVSSSGRSVSSVCRELGVSPGFVSARRWKKKQQGKIDDKENKM